jgi:hypothetical protein
MSYNRTPGRWKARRTPTSNPFRVSRSMAIRMTERDMQKCVKCRSPRWQHEKQELIPDHDFEEQQP